MASPEFVVVEATSNAVEAEYLRGVLEEHGVPAFVDGAAVNTVLSHVGSALGGVKIYVRTVDAERACEIVENLSEESEDSGEPWYCGACEESVDGSFEVCWSCGKHRDEVERPFPEDDPSESDDDHEDYGLSIPEFSGPTKANPYAAPMTPEDMMSNPEQPEINEAVEAIVLRAWRSSILGVFLLPFILHLYSLVLLIRVSKMTNVFSPAGKRRFYQAMVVNVLAGFAFVLFLLGLVIAGPYMLVVVIGSIGEFASQF